MMKKYVKPDLYFESFQLTQHIAACGYDLVNSADPDNCVSHGDEHYIYTNYGESLTFFASGNAACVNNEPQIFCYFNGTVTDDMYKVLVS